MRRGGDRRRVGWGAAALGVGGVLAGVGAAVGQCERFPAHVDYQQNVAGLACADVDGDGDVDVIVGGATLRVMVNDGLGGFVVRTAYAGPVSRVVAGDLDGDGDIDVVGVRTGSLDVLLNGGAGEFAPPVPYGELALDSLVLADLDGDGRLDVGGCRDAFVYTYRNRGDGTFDAPIGHETGGDNVALVALDLNNDGDLDLAAANASSSQVYILWNRGDGSFSPAQPHVLGGSTIVYAIAGADMSGDGLGDLVVGCAADSGGKGSARLRVLVNDEDGVFTEGDSAEVPGFPQTIVLGDFDGDADADVAVTTVVGQVTLVLANRAGNLEPAWTLSARPYPTQVTAADFNGDGRIDVAVSANQPFPPVGYLSVLLNAGCCRTDANGDGAVNSTDVGEFANLYFRDIAEGTLGADFDENGVVNSADVGAFIDVWFGESAGSCR